MRKIQTQSEIERKRKRNVLIISSLMLGLLVLSTLSFAFLTAPAKQDLNDLEDDSSDSKFGDKLRIDYSGQSFYLLSSKADIESIEVNINALPGDFSGKNLYVAADNQGILQEIASSLGKFSSRFQEACYGACEKNLPEKNCTGIDNLIVWKESEANKVYQEEKCVFIEGDMRAVDAFIYKLFSFKF